MKPTESQLEHLMIMTREYFDNIPSRYRSVPQWEEASKDVIGLLSNLSKLLKSDKLDELAKEMETILTLNPTPTLTKIVTMMSNGITDLINLSNN
jgi:hypothetical protein